MAGKHRAGRSRRTSTHMAIPAQQGPRPIGIADARTRIEHLVTHQAFGKYRRSGRYLAVCGARVLAASLTAPDRGRCSDCVIRVVSR